MLKTCVKYDLKAILRLWWIVAVSMLGASLVAGIGIRLFTESVRISELGDDAGALTFLGVFGMLAAMLCIVALFAGLTVSFILIY